MLPMLLLVLSSPVRAGCEDVVVHPADGAEIPRNLAAVFWRAGSPCLFEERELTVNGEVVEAPPGHGDEWFTMPRGLMAGDEVRFTLFAWGDEGPLDPDQPLIDAAWTVSDEVIDRSALELIVHESELTFSSRIAAGTARVQVVGHNDWDVVALQANRGGPLLDWQLPPASGDAFTLHGRNDEQSLSNHRVCPFVTLADGPEGQVDWGEDCSRPSRWACSHAPGPGSSGLALALLAGLGLLRRRHRARQP